MIDEKLNNSEKPPVSPEAGKSAEREAVKSEITEIVDEIGERCPDCDGEMTLEAVKAYCENCLSQYETETKSRAFEVSKPETRTYSPDETYSFLVHVPLGDVEQRLGEVGSERGGVLMTTLLNNERQGTFCGEGGLLLDAPDAKAIKGMSRVDCGGEIADGRMDSVEELQEPASTAEYNQIDMKFDGGKVVGVMLKVTPEGKELGDPARNTQLREVAERHGLPVATVEVAPSPMPTEQSSTTREFADGNSLTTYDIPDGNDRFLRVDIAHGNFYHSPGIDTISRSMTIDQYGQVSQSLTPEQEQKIRTTIGELLERDDLSEKEQKAVLDGFLPHHE
jgi:hypothetical protein